MKEPEARCSKCGRDLRKSVRTIILSNLFLICHCKNVRIIPEFRRALD